MNEEGVAIFIYKYDGWVQKKKVEFSIFSYISRKSPSCIFTIHSKGQQPPPHLKRLESTTLVIKAFKETWKHNFNN